MIRASACLVLILSSMLITATAGPQNEGLSAKAQSTFPAFNPYSHDPNGTLVAFNSTLAHFDLYTNASTGTSISPPQPGSTLTWSSKFNSTIDGHRIPGTSFNYTIIAGPSSQITQTLNWTLNIPKGVSGLTYVRFVWNGTLGAGTGARYLVLNGTTPTAPIFRRVVENGTFTGNPSNVTSLETGAPLACNSGDECFDVTKLIGYDVTLVFLFNSTVTGSGLKVQVSNIEVGSVGTLYNPASSHWMLLNATDPSEVIHYAKMSVKYNSTVQYIPRPPISNQTVVHTWGQMVLTLYWPASFTLESVSINATGIFPTASPAIALLQGTCVPILPTLECAKGEFVSLNMTSPLDKVSNGVALFTAQSTNALRSLKVGVGGVDTDFWTPGDNLTLRVVNQPGVNRTGPQVTWFTDPNGITPVDNTTLSFGARPGKANYSIALPSSPLGIWMITTTFMNSYDFGLQSHRFRIDELQIKPGLSVIGGAGKGTYLNVTGGLSYMPSPNQNSTAASNVNTTVFAIGTGPGASLVYTKGVASSGLYISNITAVNGIGTVGRPIVMYFSLVNPTSGQLNASLTIDHEWYSGQAHGVNVTLPLKLGDEPFLNTPVTYSLQAAFTGAGIQLTIESLHTTSQITVNMTPGTGASAVSFLRQHSGLFKLTIRSSSSAGVLPSQSLESPSYAYLLYLPLVSSHLLAYSSTVTTSSNGSFFTSFSSNQLVGAKNLLLIVLARDANGVVLGDSNHNPTVAVDSTILIPTADIPSDATIQQSITITLHLKSNSTKIAITLDINLDITGSTNIPPQTKTVTLAPGQTGNIPFTLTAPSAAGLYLVTFSSPQYGPSGSPLLAKTLQVSLIASNLQILIPAAIGLIVAIVILGVYIVRRSPEEEVKGSEKTRPAAGKPKPQAGQSISKYLTRS